MPRLLIVTWHLPFASGLLHVFVALLKHVSGRIAMLCVSFVWVLMSRISNRSLYVEPMYTGSSLEAKTYWNFNVDAVVVVKAI
jgi:hypothetical protein